MFLERRDEFSGWRFSHEVVWEKQNGTGAASDRFKRVHELALHWYSGPWKDVYRDVPRVVATPEQITRNGKALRHTTGAHFGEYGTAKAWTEDGTRLMRSVVKVKNLHGAAIHPTEKPTRLLAPLISYACPQQGLVIDLFAGSGSTLDAARSMGRRAIGIEISEEYAERAAKRLSQLILGGAPDGT
jgi:site-specific DNA-methyltransferase (adenine-specific)